MTRIRLPYIQEFRDRHGKVRRYFRRAGFPLVQLPGAPGSTEFMEHYQAAASGHELRAPIGSSRSAPGTISAAIAAYYADSSFRDGLAPATQGMRRAILERFRSEHGEKRIALLQRPHIAKMLGSKRPFAARNWLKTIRGLMQFAVAIGLRPDDPTDGIKPVKAPTTDGFHTWSEEEIAQFETAHPIGSRPRLAMALLLYTAQRRSDVIRLGPQHIRDGMITVRAQKTSRTTGKILQIPVHPELASILAATPAGHLTFLTTTAGAPFTAAGFGNLFREWCDEAGLKACTAHGLRKAQCRRLAEAGCSEHQIAAISGHESLAEIRRYTRAAEQSAMARAAMATVTAAFPAAGTKGSRAK
ncbi:MAG TPA: tyrosine-type recombinase/integrase [Stellaceae bacterium]|nr:tyrosine-type recombinase/integrase [Stellaceae bacterium]